MRVAQAAPAAAGDHGPLAARDQVGDQLAGRVVVDRGAGRDGQDEVVAGLAVAPRALAATAGRRLEMLLDLEVAQRRLAGVHLEVDRAAATAVAAVGAAARDVRLAPERRGPVTAVAGADPDRHAVEEHRMSHSSHGRLRATAPARG